MARSNKGGTTKGKSTAAKRKPRRKQEVLEPAPF
jgi:hypothetical protein